MVRKSKEPFVGLRVGAHTSIGGGLHKALERGEAAHCDVIQVFTKSSQQWAAKKITAQDLAAWRAARERTGVDPALAHTSYLLNLAAPTREAWQKANQGLALEYRRCLELGIPGMVVHPGAHLGEGIHAGIARIARSINTLFSDQPAGTTLLLENTAGQGTGIGHTFEQLRDILAAVDSPERIGICIDTCHTLAAGYDIRSSSGWHHTFERLEQAVGCHWVRAFHVNDSKTPLGSRVDRHAHLGQGHVGLAGFRLLVNDSRFLGLPMVIETPKSTEHSDSINLAVLRSLAGKKRVTARAKQLAAQSHERPPL